MHNDAVLVSPVDRRRHRRQMLAALTRKEWHEQRWRFFLGTVVVSGLLGGMLRAQLVPFNEAALTIYWPVGLIMVIFLAMGPVATEKSDRTWEFLLAQPVSRADVLLAKWRVGLWQLVGMIAIATAFGLGAMWSRGFYGRTSALRDLSLQESVSDVVMWAAGHPAIWVCLLALTAAVTLSCWYTVLFVILTRARNEFTAAMGGILLTIAVHAWLLQMAFEQLRVPALFNPMAPFVVMSYPKYVMWLPLMLLGHILLWIVVPVLLVRWFAGRARRQ
jgi:ABC-type Na+ efflux pump permease subunit